MNLFVKTKTIPADKYPVPEGWEPSSALRFSREQAPPAYLAVMVELQDRIADMSSLVATMATSKDHGYIAHAAGQLCALQEMWDHIERIREESHRTIN